MTHPTGPLPTLAPLSDFASPTIEVPYTAPDDHPLDDAAPASEMRLLAAMQRIGYLESQLEQWQAEAAHREEQVQRLIQANDALLAQLRAQPRRWFPFNW